MSYPKKPEWLRKRIFDSPRKKEVLELLERRKLHTVCQGAKCPNLCECFDRGTATFMVLGNDCTRRCSFCAVGKGCPSPVDTDEPLRVAEAIAELNLRHAVITSVTRDDLPDGGASHFASVIREIRRLAPGTIIEILTPDFRGDLSALDAFVGHLPHIFNHNLETVPRLYAIRPAADYRRSLTLLRAFKERFPSVTTKSGLMVGLGETEEEMVALFKELRAHHCEILSIGQYLAPTSAHTPVVAFVTPEQFQTYETIAREMGFLEVFSGPFVRSSYMAEKVTLPST